MTPDRDLKERLVEAARKYEDTLPDLSPLNRAAVERHIADIGVALACISTLEGEAKSASGGWRDIASAPRDNSHVIVRTALGRVFSAFMGTPVVGESGDDLAWTAADEGIHPPCWTDGICWSSNEDEEPSDPPVAWLPIPQEGEER